MRPASNEKLRQAGKTFVALLVAAIVAAIVVAILIGISVQSAQGAGIGFLIALAFTAAHAFILGGPLLLLGIKLRAVRWWSCLLAGFLIGFIPSALASNPRYAVAWPMGLLGVVGGLTFWLLWHFWVEGASGKPVMAQDVPGGTANADG